MTVTTLEAAGWFVVSLVTLLGDPLVIAGLGLGVFWFGDRLQVAGDRFEPGRGALAFAAIIGALALSVALKTGFGLARPPGATDLPGVAGMPDTVARIYTWIVGPGGYAFPSGHATAATVGWLGLAWAFRGENRDRPFAFAGSMVAAVAVSRVVLGVHRPVEVVAGITVGLAYLVVVFEVLARPRRAFALAGLLGAVGPIFVELSVDGLLVAGVALGTAVGAEGIRGRDRGGSKSMGLAMTAVLVMTGVTFVRAGGFGTLVAAAGIALGALVVAVRRSKSGVENG
ncbi:phosphatase PAP2 family protein [Halorhabdus amylolytica]|uniref:phosphatase PAP2 family protein n=1 Tax=Halorhabdus amylolytica TaxID=2559573 RepID=UPI0020C10209|nr:phosphatase PAP2 family protein [Halorhabdus amylolytica]